jgi:hypothetical protein
VLQVPYHLDEYLPDLDFPLEAAEIISADLPSGGTWGRLAVSGYEPARPPVSTSAPERRRSLTD